MYSSYSNNGFSVPNFENMIKPLSISEVKETLSDSEKALKMIKDTDEINNMKKHKENLVQENRRIAQENLELEPEFNTHKLALIQTHSKFKELQESYEDLRVKIESHGTKQSTSTILALLQAAGAEAEEESEQIASQFLAKELEMDEFFKQFIAKRTLYNERHMKCEKLSQQLASTGSSQAANASASQAQTNNNFFIQQPTFSPPNFPPYPSLPYTNPALYPTNSGYYDYSKPPHQYFS